MCLKAYARMSSITKLKYVGVVRDDLIDVYKLFNKSLLEYCCVAFHSSLNLDNIQDIERIQKTALRVIFGEDYQDYQSALRQSGLETPTLDVSLDV